MNQQYFSCCICKDLLNISSQPRLMPNCQHNACNSCLKKVLAQKQNRIIICLHCGHQQQIHEQDIEFFPKNHSLLKILKEKSEISAPEPKIAINSSKQNSRETQGSVNEEKEYCEKHKKQLEIICICDCVRLCPHCALFGDHRDHNIKTIKEVQAMIREKDNQFSELCSRRRQIENKINGAGFKESIIKKIGEEKERLIKDIKKKFAKLYQNIKLAEKKAYEDVIKNFKEVYTRISALIKEEHCQKKYRLWELKCTELFNKANKLRAIEDKAALYFNGPLEICSEGEPLLNSIETKINKNMWTIEKLIAQIQVRQNQSVANSVFNYVNVRIVDSKAQTLDFFHEDIISPIFHKETDHCTKIQFGASHLVSNYEARQDVSPVTSNNQSPTKDKSSHTPPGRRFSDRKPTDNQKISVELMVEQFCVRDNLDTLDLTGYSLSDSEIYDILKYVKSTKKIKGLKLVKNRLTNEGLGKILDFIPAVTNLNLAFNNLGDESLLKILASRSKIGQLRIINLSNNKINERKSKSIIDELKKQGLIVTI